MPTTTSLGLALRSPGEQETLATTAGNWELVNRLFLRLMGHRHGGVNGDFAGAPLPPVAAQTSDPGRLPAGTQIFYRSAVVHDGVESPASVSTFLTTSSFISPPELAPEAIEVLTSGGDLISGVFVYALTSWVGSPANETRAIAPVTVQLQSIDGNNQRVSITLPALPAGADGFNIYRRYPNSIETYQIASLTGEQEDPYIDSSGSEVVAPFVVLPTTDRSGFRRTVQLTRPTDLEPDDTWRVYRSFDDALWESTYLGSTDGDTFLDTGAAPNLGAPIEGASIPYTEPPLVGGQDIREVPVTHRFAEPGAAGTGPLGAEWVIPYDNVFLEGAVLSVDRASAPVTNPLVVKLQVWLGSWSDLATLTLPTSDSEVTVDLSPDEFDLGSNVRIRATVDSVDGVEQNPALEVRLWAKTAAWAPPVWP